MEDGWCNSGIVVISFNIYMHDNMTDFLDPLLSHSTLVQAYGNGHTHPHTFLVFYPLRNLEEGVRSISALHTSFPPSLHSFSISSFYVISLLPRLPCAPPFFFLPLFLTSSPPLLISLSLSLHASLSSSPRLLYLPFPPPSFGVCLSPSTPPLPSSFLLSSSVSLCLTRLPLILPASLALCSPHSATINYAQTQCTSLCSPPPDNSF